MGVKNFPPIAPNELIVKEAPLRSGIFSFLVFAALARLQFLQRY